MAQTWNDVLEYIKINLGVPVNILEIEDDDIVKLLKNQVLTLFSQFAPKKKFGMIKSEDLIQQDKLGAPQWQYRIPLTAEEYVIDIRDVYAGRKPEILDTFANRAMRSTDVAEVAMANTFSDMIKSMSTRQSWEFIPPDILIFDKEFRYGVVEYFTVHDNLSSIEPDKYHIYFKKLCLAKVKLWISSMRSKFEQLNTPAAQIQLNWESLRSEGKEEEREVMEGLNLLPTDFLIYID